jgi:aminoglycoside N3'-acetyltransferase
LQVGRKLIDLVLRKVGIEEGDMVPLHSDSTAIMEITELKRADVLDLLKDSFINVLGASGTLIVPTSN